MRTPVFVFLVLFLAVVSGCGSDEKKAERRSHEAGSPAPGTEIAQVDPRQSAPQQSGRHQDEGNSQTLAGDVGGPEIYLEVRRASFQLNLADVGIVELKISTAGSAPDKLIGVQANLPGASARIVKIQNLLDGTVTTVPAIEIPANTVTEGVTVWISGIPHSLKIGDEFSLVITFEHSGSRTLKVKFESFSMVDTKDLGIKAKALAEAGKRSPKKTEM
ncbi:MAG: hypothetical protein V2A71_01840 [Candidatus Eisenbacteria bacterium]